MCIHNLLYICDFYVHVFVGRYVFVMAVCTFEVYQAGNRTLYDARRPSVAANRSGF